MQSLFIVFLGGGLGSVVRYSLGRWINSTHHQVFPWGTLVVNVIACFLLGLIVGLADHKQLFSASARLFWTVGFCGGFSTFSTFSHETLSLLQQGFTLQLLAYIFLSLVLCVAVTFSGIYLAQQA
jgi:fluoride exporter